MWCWQTFNSTGKPPSSNGSIWDDGKICSAANDSLKDSIMKNTKLIPLLIGMAIGPLTVTTWGQVELTTIETTKTTVNLIGKPGDYDNLPQAIVLSVDGKCDYSEDGTNFTELKADQVLQQGALVRTGKSGSADLFFRRIGTSVRLQSGTEMKLENLERHVKDGHPVMLTLLDLRTGRIFTVVRSLVPGSTFEIRNAAGRSVVEGGGGKGRYIITADGTHVMEKGSTVPIRVIGETGITVIEPGMEYRVKDGKLFPQEAPEDVKLLIQLDQMDSLAEGWTKQDKSSNRK
jgi:hypothetical protein